MARINTYVSDTTVNSSDKFLGSNSGGQTKNFAVQDIVKFLKATNGGGAAGQLSYLYHKNDFGGFGSRQPGTISVPGETNTFKAFSSLSTLRVSKYTNGSDNTINNFLSTFVDEVIIIADTEYQDKFGAFIVTAVTQDSTETNFYNVSLTPVPNQSNGNIENLRSYSISVFTAGDKNILHTQSSASNSWTVDHNMGKYPSVSIVECDPSANETDGDLVIGEVTYNSINQLTIKFAAAISGVAYIN